MRYHTVGPDISHDSVHVDFRDNIFFAQGARCGHIEGRGRADQYIIGEEIDLSWEAADNQDLSQRGGASGPSQCHAWAKGYQYGYRLAAEGSELPSELK